VKLWLILTIGRAVQNLRNFLESRLTKPLNAAYDREKGYR
jgi:hypothetical protein